MEQEIASQVVGLGGSSDFSLLSLFLRADFVVKVSYYNFDCLLQYILGR